MNSQSQVLFNNDTILSWKASGNLERKDYLGKVDSNAFEYAMTSYKIEILPEIIC
jgi:hypothetical protein